MNGAQLACTVLRGLDVQCVFGLPGTQNVRLYEAMRAGGLRRVVPVDEGSAAFMAAGYARASGRVGVLTTIPGPGFVYALPGIVEARHDSTPLLWITLKQRDEGRAFQLQRIDQAALAAPVVKRHYPVESIEGLAHALQDAHATALAGEPGPVLVEIDAPVLEADARQCENTRGSSPADTAFDALGAALAASRRPLLYVGQGARGAAQQVRELARRIGAPVFCTSSGRGVVPDSDPLMFVQDFSTGLGTVLPEMLERADLVLALGCKFTHNGSAGGLLALPAAKLARVDTSAEVLAANYPAKVAVVGDVAHVMRWLGQIALSPSQWEPTELASFKARLADANAETIPLEPSAPDVSPASVRGFFAALHRVFGADAVYVTDAGLHQALTRRYAIVERPGGLLCPSDFQSMGFGLPGAIGTAIAMPAAKVIACVGDGGLALSLGDLGSAVREGVDIVVVVFADGQMNLIRRQQMATYGHESGVSVHGLDFGALAEAVGCSYFPMAGMLDDRLEAVAGARGVRLVELRLADHPSTEWQRRRSMLRESARARIPSGAWNAIKKGLLPR